MNSSTSAPARTRLGRLGATFVALTVITSFAAQLLGMSPAAADPPTALTSLNVPATSFLGENFSFSVTLDNGAATGVGYGPMIDLFIPLIGADGAGVGIDDGVTFTNATYLGAPVVVARTTAITACPFAHPITGLPVTCPSGIAVGDQLRVLELPFGSFTAPQPPAVINVNGAISNRADVGTPLSIVARSFFRYGADPLDNPLTDAPIIGATTTATVTPTLVTLTKSYLGPESETATGPNFPKSYALTVDIADGQTITDLDITDLLPDDHVYQSVGSFVPGTGVATTEPSSAAPQDPPNNQLIVEWPSVTGTTGSGDASTAYTFYVNNVDAAGGGAVNVIDPATGDDVTALNSASATYDWTPIDGTDTVVDNASTNTSTHTLTEKSIAIQKSATIQTDIGAVGASPGDTLLWTLNFQVSDYFTFGDLDITDVLSDGQDFVTATAPTFSMTDRDGTFAGNFTDPASYTFAVDNTPCGTGDTTASFDVGAALTSAGSPNTILTGGLVNGGAFGGTVGTVTYRTTIRSAYRCTVPSTNPVVDSGDTIDNSVTISGEVYNNVTQLPQGLPRTEDDTSVDAVTIVSSTLAKSIYAKNGSLVGPFTSFAPGDTITYRLTQTLPLQNVENLRFTDFMPLPVLPVAGFNTTFNTTVSVAAPSTGTAKFGPSDTFFAASAITPTITIDTTGNSLVFNYGTYQGGSGTSSAVIDLLFTDTIENDPFADGLFLTNQARSESQSSFLTAVNSDGIIQFQLAQPNLSIRKGVISSDNPEDVYAPTILGPVAFTAPGDVVPPRWTGTINSTGLAAAAINSNITDGVDGGDIVSFAIVVENAGSSPYGAFDVSILDTLPSGFAVPGGGLNLQVTNGAGTALPFTNIGAGTGLFDQGIVLTDPAPLDGALDAFSTTSGTNLVIVTYDLQLQSTVSSDQDITNTATLTNYASTEGGPDFTPTDLTDDATVDVATPQITKTIVGTNVADTTGNNVAIGELVTYEVRVRVPEGFTASFDVIDTLDAGLAFDEMVNVTSSGALSSSGGSIVTLGNAPVISSVGTGSTAPGRRASWAFADITNADTDNTTDEEIVLQYQVAVLNASTVGRGSALNNSVASEGGAGSAPNVTVVEPTLQIAKTVLPTTADGGDTVTFTMVVSHTVASNQNSHDITLTDVIPAGFTYVPATLANVSGVAATLDDSAAPTLGASWTALNLGQTSTLRFDAVISNSVAAGATLTNTASIRWTSLPGSVGTSQSTHNTLSVERTGNVADIGTTTNDNTTSDPADVTVAASAPVKTLIATSETETSGSNVTIGEIVTYRVVVALPESSITSFSVVDRLPAGLAYVSGSATVTTSGAPLTAPFAGSLPAPTITSSGGSGDDITFAFGVTTVTADNDATNNAFFVEVQALVLDVPGNVGVVSSQTQLSNTADLVIGATTVSSPAVVTPVVEPVIGITKTFAPTSAAPGDTVTITVVVANTGTSPSYDTIVRDPVQDNRLASITEGSTQSGFTYSTSNLAGVTTIQWAGGTINALASATFTYTATLPSNLTAGTTIPNTATVTQATTLSGTVTGERDQPDVSDLDTLTVVTPDIRVGKTDSDLNVFPGDTVTYTITITNDGGYIGEDIVVTDTIDANTTFVSASLGGSETAPGSGIVTWPVFPLAPAASTTRTITVTVDNPVPLGTVSITNTVNAVDDGTHGADPTPLNNTATDVDAVGFAPDLSIAKTDFVTSTTAGATLTYTIAVTNEGDQDANNVVVTDTIPTYTTFVSATAGGAQTAPGSGIVTWPAFSLAANNATTTRTVTVQLNVSIPAAVTTITNNVSVTDGAGGDINAGNDTATDVDTLVATPDIRVSKTNDVTTLVRGQTTTYTITITNDGAQDATGVLIADTIDSGTTFSAASAGGTETAPGSGIVTWPTFPLASGASTTRTVTVAVDAVQSPSTVSYTNSVNVVDDGANGPDPTPGNNTATDTDTGGIDLRVSKDDGSPNARPGSRITYIITVTNLGPDTATEAQVTDVLPSSLSNPVYAVSTGVFTSGSGVWNGFTLAPTQSMTLTVSADLSPTATGTLTNTATVIPTDIGDPTLSNNTDDDVDTILPEIELQLTKEAVGTFRPGGLGTYRFTVLNAGTDTATNVKIVDVLPAGLAPTDDSSNPPWTCASVGNTVTCSLAGSLAPGQSTTVALVVRVTATSGTIINTATVSASGYDPVLPNNTDDVPVAVLSSRIGNLAASGDRQARNAASDGTALLLLGMALVVTARVRRKPSS